MARAWSLSSPRNVVARWFLGRPVLMPHEWRPTNATFWRRGTKRFPGYEADRLTFWVYLPEGIRSAIRQGCLTLLICSWWIYQWITSHTVTSSLIGLALLVAGVRGAHRWWRMRTFHNTYTKPLAQTAGKILNIPPYTRTSTWLRISPNMPGLHPVVKPMGRIEARFRATYGQHFEPAVRYIPDQLTRGYWWVTGRYAPLAAAWRSKK